MQGGSKRDLLLITTLGVFFFIFGNWILSLTSPDEGRNAYAALHMLKSGDWIAPYYNCHPRFEKPPLLYWLMALSFKLFGVNEFAARLPSGLAALGTAIITYLIAKNFFNKKIALYSGLTFLLFIHNWVESRSATPEMLLVFFSTLGVYLFLTERFTLGWLALALAFLAKGPVGVALPVAVYYLWKLAEEKNPKQTTLKVIKNLLNVKGLILFAIVGSSWYLLMLHKFGWEYFYAFFVKQNIDRFLGKLGAHHYPFWYYIPIVVTSAALFLPLLPKIVLRFDKKLLPPVVWFAFVFLFYSISKEKLHHYVLFAYPPLALLFAAYTSERYLKTALAAGAILLAGVLTAAHLYEKERFTPKAVDYLKRENPQRLLFFRDENSAIVFYLYRCIPEENNPRKIPEGAFVITKAKYKYLLTEGGRFKLILEGKEFGKKREYLFKKE